MSNRSHDCTFDVQPTRAILLLDDPLVRSREAERIFNGRRSRTFAALQTMIERKLVMLDNAATLDDLRSPPANRLEALKGDRRGQHSIRVNAQFRLCFRWTAAGPEDVELVDYH